MSKTFEQSKAEVAALCEYFAKNRAAFCAPGRKEAQVRQDLIDPFFRALGWDVGNAARVAPQYCGATRAALPTSQPSALKNGSIRSCRTWASFLPGAQKAA